MCITYDVTYNSKNIMIIVVLLLLLLLLLLRPLCLCYEYRSFGKRGSGSKDGSLYALFRRIVAQEGVLGFKPQRLEEHGERQIE